MRKLHATFLLVCFIVITSSAFGQNFLKQLEKSSKALAEKSSAKEAVLLHQAFGVGPVANSLRAPFAHKTGVAAMAATSLEKQVRLAAETQFLQSKTVTWISNEYQTLLAYLLQKKGATAPVFYLAADPGAEAELEQFVSTLRSLRGKNIYLLGQFGPKTVLLGGEDSVSHYTFYSAVRRLSGPGFMAYGSRGSLVWREETGPMTRFVAPNLYSDFLVERFLLRYASSGETVSAGVFAPFASNQMLGEKLLQEYQASNAAGKPMPKVNRDMEQHIAAVEHFVRQNDPEALIVVVSRAARYRQTGAGLAQRTATLTGRNNQTVIHFTLPVWAGSHQTDWNRAANMTEATLASFAAGPDEKLIQEVSDPDLALRFGSDVRVLVHSK